MLFCDVQFLTYDPRFMQNWDPDRFAEQVAQTKADIFMWTIKCALGYAYYNTQVGTKYPAFGEHDPLAELIERVHKRNIKFYVWHPALSDKPLWETHPDWRQRGSECLPNEILEKIQYKTGVTAPMKFYCLCPNSPAGEVIIEEAKEVAENYPIDGYWLDMGHYFLPMGVMGVSDKYGAGGAVPCYCDYCQKKFQAEHHAEIPKSSEANPALWVTYVRWKRRQVYDWYKKLFGAVKEANPKIVTGLNSSLPSWAGGTSVEQGELVDMRVHDTYGNKGDLVTSLTIEGLKGTCPTRIATPSVYRFSSKPRVFTFWESSKEQEHWLLEAMTSLTHGCRPMLSDYLRLDGTMHEKFIEDATEILGEVHKRKEWTENARPVKFAALYYSQDSRDFYGEQSEMPDHYILSGSLVHDNWYFSGFIGAFKALLDEHIPLEIVTHRDLDRLSDYAVLILPNVACLSNEEVEGIKEYVRNGGGLVATYDTSLYSGDGQLLLNFQLGEVFGADYCGRTGFWQDYIRLEKADHPIAEGLDARRLLQHVGSQIKVRCRKGADVIGSITVPYRREELGRGLECYTSLTQQPFTDTPLPSIVTNRYGKGKVVYFPGRIDATYREEELAELRHLLANGVCWAARTASPIELEGHSHMRVNAFIQDNKKRMIVHLLNVQPLEQIVPVRDVEVKVRSEERPVKRVYLAPEEREVDYKRDGEYVTVTVPEVPIHKMVVIEF